MDAFTLSIPSALMSKLEALAKELTEQLGFPVTAANTMGWLVRQNESWTEYVAPSKPSIPSMDARAEALMRNGQKISAIKIVREETNMGLKEAKDYVESRWQHLIPPRE